MVIEATNIRGGGGVTHLVELLKAVKPSSHNIEKIYLCANKNTLNKIEDRPWLIKHHDKVFEKGLLHRFFWQTFLFKKFLKIQKCDILFIPGGIYFGFWKPFVTMSQNLLPFEWKELRRYGFSKMTLKMILVRIAQTLTFKKADGVIFLTNFAKKIVLNTTNLNINSSVIPHGINKNFESFPKSQNSIAQYSTNNPFKILYVSSIDVYKHQNHVITAISILHKQGIPIMLDLVGPPHYYPLKKMKKIINKLDANNFVKYHGTLPYEILNEKYKSADMGIFASSCETFGQIVTEGMSAGLPFACSELSAMPEILGNAGVYFHPESPISIASAVKKLIMNPELRKEKALLGFHYSKKFSWEKCSNSTFKFISGSAKNES